MPVLLMLLVFLLQDVLLAEDCGRYTEALGDFSIRAADFSRRGYSKCSVQIVAPQNRSIKLSITRLKGFPPVNITNPLAQCLPKLEVREEGLLGDVRLVYSICNGLEEDSIPLNIHSTEHQIILDFLWDSSADSSFQASYSFQDSTQVEGEKDTFEEQVTCAFQCSDNQCLPTMQLVCNGRKDCQDNSDEKDCQMNSASLVDTQNTEFIQIIVIVVAVTVTVAVISCIFNHYKRARNSWMERRSQRERVLYSPRTRREREQERLARQESLQRQTLTIQQQPRFHFPHSDIDLPPAIQLSDGEEHPPYTDQRHLQLRNPDQQRELERESVQPPPNRTIFDRPDFPLYDTGQFPGPPSHHSGTHTRTQYGSTNSSYGDPPPRYSDVVSSPQKYEVKSGAAGSGKV
ncbi:PREDICTED: low-density lipoprotein receptor class A domain-containing protein 4-like [Branchiostoma belcheri]|uniref:Low-density lipoprotein receptor class A domain-containing protein 4-like n=1 Tax=Branchiostoma belcheri TaxID=7741 RepID=A0A6P4ZWB2_BRABE|nr:PREDICTED: low-density lipoprotein receptor class A domain-containing protein 4-like [Branchiostoma belcheri]